MVSCILVPPGVEQRIFVQPHAVYLGRYLIGEAEYHFWNCTISMINRSSEDVQILECSAEVIDPKGMITKVSSLAGIVDRVVKKNEALEYIAGVHLRGVSGVLRSSYEVKFMHSGFVVCIDGNLCSVDALSLGDCH